ncbi:MAG: hypothetical protein KGI75_28525 [Rhizobiaceae bacterium]|nr:hypothetical protein [Rhizobiaceae bacterium]
MTDEGPDGFMMIGLHRLTSRNGEDMVPELYELLAQRAEQQAMRASNVVMFPIWAARFPGERPKTPLDVSARDGTNVIAFALRSGKTDERRKKV